MKTFPSAIIIAVLALCISPVLAFAQEAEQVGTVEQKLNLIQSGEYVLPGEASVGQLGIQSDGPLSASQESSLRDRFANACKSVQSNVDVADLAISVSDAAQQQMMDILSEVVNSNSDLFYVNNGMSFSWISGRDPRTGASYSRYSTIGISYDYTSAQINSMKEKYNSALKDVLSWVPSDATEVQKAKAVHDWLVRNCSYNTQAANAGPESYGSKNPWNAYGALVEKKPVCQGYALAFSAVMSELGIKSTYVGQEVSGKGGHGWNRALIDGSWYNIDVTWDDPTPDGGFDAVPFTTYFMKSDAWFKTNKTTDGFHTSWSPAGEAATDTRYDAYAEKDWPTYNAPAQNGSNETPSTEPVNPGTDPTPGGNTDPGTDPTPGGNTDPGTDPTPGGNTTPEVTKKANDVAFTGKTITVKLKNLKKKKKLTFKPAKAFAVKNAKGAVSYEKKFGSKKVSVAANGTITVKKGLKKGSYGVVVTATDAGTDAYYPVSKSVTVTIKVK